MSTRVGFLRAVNVGRRTVPMKRLAEVVTSLGYDDVWTYINSGNVVFDAPGARAEIERAIGEALESEFGFEVTTFVRTPAEIRKVVAFDPFELDEGDMYYVTFAKDTPSAEAVEALEAASNDFDTLIVHGREVHWRMRGRSVDTTVPKKTWNLLGHFGGTSRNIRMLRKLSGKIADQRSA